MDRIRLGDACEILNGYAFRSENYVESGIRVIRISNVQKGYIEDNTPAYYPLDSNGLDRFMLEEGDLLMSLTGNVGRVAILEKKFLPAALNQRVACLRLKSDKLSKRYLFHILNSDFFEQQCILSSKGVAQKNMSTEWLKDFEIPLYPTEKQEEITDILDKTHNVIACRIQELQKLDELVKARFIELFGDLKANPKGWPIMPFPEFAEIDCNMTTDYEKYADYPHIGIDSIEKGTGELKGYRTVREDGVISGKYIFTPQHIIYSKIRPNLNKVALPDFEGLCSADAYPILPNHENCNRVFLAVAMRSEYYLEYILQFSSRTNLPKVNRKEIAGFRMPLPPLALQEQFATFVEQTDKSKVIENNTLRCLKYSLMPGLMAA
ncbi:MAG: restriction endonuclease subunit S [Clostridiales bacterium]|nr:restriction endonuclease subunit S [Clostridiales bacterium]MDY4111808.1 restriction endonuclease subunit S [Roseburia sp.]